MQSSQTISHAGPSFLFSGGSLRLHQNALLVKAAMPYTPVLVDASCCAGVTPESHRNALEAMKMCQIQIV